jgi:predicted nucleic acid-binding protein
MPQNNILKINDYQAKADDSFFLDNNVWMYVFCPLANFGGKRQAAYSKFLEYILSRKLHIYINSLVLAEFSNRYLRLDFALCNKTGNPQVYNSFKKDYVGSPQFEKTVKDLKSFLTQIIKLCQRCSDEFNAINIDDVLKLFEKIGFNDSYYLYLSKRKNWIVVTDDSDFTNNNIPQLGLTILTI